jgi:hypothetical protein
MQFVLFYYLVRCGLLDLFQYLKLQPRNNITLCIENDERIKQSDVDDSTGAN